MRRRVTVGLTLTGGLAVTCLLAHAFVHIDASAQATTGAQSPLTVSSPVVGTGLYPGRSETVPVAVHNPNGFPTIVTAISAGDSDAFVNSANGQTCPAGTVTSSATVNSAGILQADGTSVAIPADGTGTYAVVVTMAAQQAGSGCAGSTFTLRLTASGRDG